MSWRDDLKDSMRNEVKDMEDSDLLTHIFFVETAIIPTIEDDEGWIDDYFNDLVRDEIDRREI